MQTALLPYLDGHARDNVIRRAEVRAGHVEKGEKVPEYDSRGREIVETVDEFMEFLQGYGAA